MCNLYSITTNQAAIIALFRVVNRYVGNLAPMPGVFPDYKAPNIRNLKSKHWTRWLGAENRCVVPFNSFSEFNKAEGGDIWFALDEARPLACFAGIWTNWTSVRKVKEGETTNDP